MQICGHIPRKIWKFKIFLLIACHVLKSCEPNKLQEVTAKTIFVPEINVNEESFKTFKHFWCLIKGSSWKASPHHTAEYSSNSLQQFSDCLIFKCPNLKEIYKIIKNFLNILLNHDFKDRKFSKKRFIVWKHFSQFFFYLRYKIFKYF